MHKQIVKKQLSGSKDGFQMIKNSGQKKQEPLFINPYTEQLQQSGTLNIQYSMPKYLINKERMHSPFNQKQENSNQLKSINNGTSDIQNQGYSLLSQIQLLKKSSPIKNFTNSNQKNRSNEEPKFLVQVGHSKLKDKSSKIKNEEYSNKIKVINSLASGEDKQIQIIRKKSYDKKYLQKDVEEITKSQELKQYHKIRFSNFENKILGQILPASGFQDQYQIVDQNSKKYVKHKNSSIDSQNQLKQGQKISDNSFSQNVFNTMQKKYFKQIQDESKQYSKQSCEKHSKQVQKSKKKSKQQCNSQSRTNKKPEWIGFTCKSEMEEEKSMIEQKKKRIEIGNMYLMNVKRRQSADKTKFKINNNKYQKARQMMNITPVKLKKQFESTYQIDQFLEKPMIQQQKQPKNYQQSFTQQEVPCIHIQIQKQDSVSQTIIKRDTIIASCDAVKKPKRVANHTLKKQEDQFIRLKESLTPNKNDISNSKKLQDRNIYNMDISLIKKEEIKKEQQNYKNIQQQYNKQYQYFQYQDDIKINENEIQNLEQEIEKEQEKNKKKEIQRKVKYIYNTLGAVIKGHKCRRFYNHNKIIKQYRVEFRDLIHSAYSFKQELIQLQSQVNSSENQIQKIKTMLLTSLKDVVQKRKQFIYQFNKLLNSNFINNTQRSISSISLQESNINSKIQQLIESQPLFNKDFRYDQSNTSIQYQETIQQKRDDSITQKSNQTNKSESQKLSSKSLQKSQYKQKFLNINNKICSENSQCVNDYKSIYREEQTNDQQQQQKSIDLKKINTTKKQQISTQQASIIENVLDNPKILNHMNCSDKMKDMLKQFQNGDYNNVSLTFGQNTGINSKDTSQDNLFSDKENKLQKDIKNYTCKYELDEENFSINQIQMIIPSQYQQQEDFINFQDQDKEIEKSYPKKFQIAQIPKLSLQNIIKQQLKSQSQLEQGQVSANQVKNKKTVEKKEFLRKGSNIRHTIYDPAKSIQQKKKSVDHITSVYKQNQYSCSPIHSVKMNIDHNSNEKYQSQSFHQQISTQQEKQPEEQKEAIIQRSLSQIIGSGLQNGKLHNSQEKIAFVSKLKPLSQSIVKILHQKVAEPNIQDNQELKNYQNQNDNLKQIYQKKVFEQNNVTNYCKEDLKNCHNVILQVFEYINKESNKNDIQKINQIIQESNQMYIQAKIKYGQRKITNPSSPQKQSDSPQKKSFQNSPIKNSEIKQKLKELDQKFDMKKIINDEQKKKNINDQADIQTGKYQNSSYKSQIQNNRYHQKTFSTNSYLSQLDQDIQTKQQLYQKCLLNDQKIQNIHEEEKKYSVLKSESPLNKIISKTQDNYKSPYKYNFDDTQQFILNQLQDSNQIKLRNKDQVIDSPSQDSPMSPIIQIKNINNNKSNSQILASICKKDSPSILEKFIQNFTHLKNQDFENKYVQIKSKSKDQKGMKETIQNNYNNLVNEEPHISIDQQTFQLNVQKIEGNSEYFIQYKDCEFQQNANINMFDLKNSNCGSFCQSANAAEKANIIESNNNFIDVENINVSIDNNKSYMNHNQSIEQSKSIKSSFRICPQTVETLSNNNGKSSVRETPIKQVPQQLFHQDLSKQSLYQRQQNLSHQIVSQCESQARRRSRGERKNKSVAKTNNNSKFKTPQIFKEFDSTHFVTQENGQQFNIISQENQLAKNISNSPFNDKNINNNSNSLKKLQQYSSNNKCQELNSSQKKLKYSKSNNFGIRTFNTFKKQ